jgi:hypothetical protein
VYVTEKARAEKGLAQKAIGYKDESHKLSLKLIYLE